MRRAIAARQDPDAIYLIDSNIYVFGAWQNRPPNYVDGQAINAVQGFLAFLFSLLERRRPRLIACAFDQRSARSIRTTLLPDYKANRPAPPTDLTSQFPLCQQVLEALGITWQSSPRIEADDIIGMWSRRAGEEGRTCVIVSADKDLCQFVSRRDAIWNYSQDTWQDYRAIENRFGVRPHQIADWLALTGDKVDNIPGVPGIGPATAARLLTKWGTIDNLIAHVDRVREMKFRGAANACERLKAAERQVRQNQQITGLIEDNSVNTKICDMTIRPDFEALAPQLDRFVNPTTRNQWLALLHSLVLAKTTP